MSTFSKENESYLRSLGYSGTRFDAPRDESLTDKNKFLYDTITKAAGDDGQLTKDEYESIYSVGDRGPWGKYAYNSDSVRDALARAAIDSGFTLDQDTLDRHNLAYDGDDLLGKFEAGEYAPSYKDKDKYSYERTIDDDEDKYNVFRYKANTNKAVDEEEEEIVIDEDPVVEDCPSGQIRGTSGTCIDDKVFADNPWEEPRKIPKALADLRSKFDSYDSGVGSIPYTTSNTEYQPRFSGFLRSMQYQQDRDN